MSRSMGMTSSSYQNKTRMITMTTTVTMTTMTEHEYDDYGWLRIEDEL